MAKRTIKLKKYLDIVVGYPAHDDNILPGHLLSLLSTGKVDGHPTADGTAVPMFALEDELQGKTIEDAYDTDEIVFVWIPQRGEEVYAVLAADENVVEGDFLVSAGDGELQKMSSSSVDSGVIGIALEDVDLSDSSGAWEPTAHQRRIKVRIV